MLLLYCILLSCKVGSYSVVVVEYGNSKDLFSSFLADNIVVEIFDDLVYPLSLAYLFQ